MFAKLTLLYSADSVLALLLTILIFTLSGERDHGRSDRVWERQLSGGERSLTLGRRAAHTVRLCAHN